MTSTPDIGDHEQYDESSESTAAEPERDVAATNGSASLEGEITELDIDREDVIPQLDEEEYGDLQEPSTPNEVIPPPPPLVEAANPFEETGSPADSGSIPDDTVSVQDYVLSSPGRAVSPLARPTLGSSPSSFHRPFDRRFQSHLSASPLARARSGSPAFLASHSRQSSLSSVAFPPSEPDETTDVWEVVTWTKLKRLTAQIFSESGRRNFGSPTCMVISDQIVVGTSRGIVLVFDRHQNHKAVIGVGTKAAESGAVTAVTISADHTTVAAGHATGHIFTWEILRPSRPFLHIPPIDAAQGQARKMDGHVFEVAVVHIGFLGYRHTALVSADDHGMAFSHLATRGMGAIARTVRTTRILGRYPDLVSRSTHSVKKSSVLAFAALPLGNVEQRTDVIGLVAMMTPYLLVVVSTTPIPQTQHKAARPKEVAVHGAMTAALAWFPAIKLKSDATTSSKTKLAYAWSNVLTVLEVEEVVQDEGEKEKPPDLHFTPRSQYRAEEAIVAIQWVSRSVIAILTITQQLLILEDVTMNVTDSSDLLPKNLYHADLYSKQLEAVVEQYDGDDSSMHGVVADAFHMSFRAYKGRLFLLGASDIWSGALTNWADRLLALMDVGDFIGAIRLATAYYAGVGEKATIGLPEDDDARASLVREKLIEMMTASLKYAFGQNQQAGNELLGEPQIKELASACITACLTINDQDFLLDDVFSWYDDNGFGSQFIDLLEPYILDGQVSTLPPAPVKVLVEHFMTNHTVSKLEEIICLLDTSTMDIDQVTGLCKKYHLYDAYIYVWTQALNDYTTPLDELSSSMGGRAYENGETSNISADRAAPQKLFPYISYVLTGRVYPTGVFMDDTIATVAKTQVYDYFFSGSSSNKVGSSLQVRSYDDLRRVLHYDSESFMSALNEAFEDSHLNVASSHDTNGSGGDRSSTLPGTKYNRQRIIYILSEVMSQGFESQETIYLDMFIARNLPKYPQELLLPGSTLHKVFLGLCDYPDSDMRFDAQLSAEYLLSIYRPADMLGLAPTLKQARFYRILKVVYKQEHCYAESIETYFEDEEYQDGIFSQVLEYLRPGSKLSTHQRDAVMDVIKQHAKDFLLIDTRQAAITIDMVEPSLHEWMLEVDDDPRVKFEYLRTLLEPEANEVSRTVDASLLELYVRLMCQLDPQHVATYVDKIKEGDLHLEAVLPSIEEGGMIDAAVILLMRQGQVRNAMDQLTKHMALLGRSLLSLLQTSQHVSETGSTQDAANDLLDSLQRYAGVGVWLCQSQTMATQTSKSIIKSPKRATLQQPLLFVEVLWLDFIICVVDVGRSISEFTKQEASGDALPEQNAANDSVRSIVQTAFTSLLNSTTTIKRSGGGDISFLRILRAFLAHAAESAPSLADLRTVLSSIFTAYAYEESFMALSNSMIDKDLFVHVDEVGQLRQRGWRPRGQTCENCGKRVWGPGAGSAIWDAWEEKERNRQQHRLHKSSSTFSEEPDTSRGKGKAAAEPVAQDQPAVKSGKARAEKPAIGPVVVFSCRHLYHRDCLTDRPHGETEIALTCPACS